MPVYEGWTIDLRCRQFRKVHEDGWIDFVEFGNQDVVRHVLVQRIVEAYKRHAEQTGTQRRR